MKGLDWRNNILLHHKHTSYATRKTWIIWNTRDLQRLEPQEKHFHWSYIWKGQCRKTKRRRQQQWEREREKESGGLELDEGHISSHWVGNSEKSPWLLKKEDIKGKTIPAEGWGQRKKLVLLFFVFLFSFFPLTVVRVVSHSAIEERCMVGSRLARPLSTRI